MAVIISVAFAEMNLIQLPDRTGYYVVVLNQTSLAEGKRSSHRHDPAGQYRSVNWVIADTAL